MLPSDAPTVNPLIKLKRIYEAPSPGDGRRYLVERLWPRGVSRERAALDAWFKELAPSPDLRRWYHHDLSRWDEFQRRYRHELNTVGSDVDTLVRLVEGGTVTFLFAARDEEHNSAVVLRAFILERLGA